MSRLKGALIGCGFFAQNHLRAWASLPEVDLVAVCDVDTAKARIAAERFGIPRHFTDAATMLRETKPDFVDIATTAASHRALVELAAGAGVPAVVQKPFGPSLADGEAMVQACATAGVALMVHENFRWQPPLRRCADLVASGSIGRPHFGRISFRSAFDVYANQPYLATDERFIIADLGIHLLDLARFFFGEVTSLACRTRRVNPRIRGEDAATMLIEHAGGVVSVVDCSYASPVEPDPFPQTMLEIDGPEGVLRLGPGYRLQQGSKGRATTETNLDPTPLPWAERPWHVIQASVLEIQRHWIRCLKDGTEPETSGRDNLKAMALVEAAYRSADTGETIRFTAGRES